VKGNKEKLKNKGKIRKSGRKKEKLRENKERMNENKKGPLCFHWKVYITPGPHDFH
jgi:hypothetical protein